MEAPYGFEWPTEEKVKRSEMVAPEARYIFVHEAPSASTSEILTMSKRKRPTNCVEDRGLMVGFVHYRFTLEEKIPVLYLYELQLEPRVQAKGLGNFLMQLIELIACKVLSYDSSLSFMLIIAEICWIKHYAVGNISKLSYDSKRFLIVLLMIMLV
jgi:hypothetical protein